MNAKTAKVDEVVARHGNDKERLIQILLDLQKEYRWLSRDMLERVSTLLDVPLNHIYNLTTFYAHFSLVPKGRHALSVCTGTACHVRGAERLLERVSREVGIGPGQTTPDEKFSLDTVNCVGACALGPVMVADGEYLSDPTTDIIRRKVRASD